MALLLTVGFWATRVTVTNSVRQALRSAARNNQFAVAQQRARVEARLARILQTVVLSPKLTARVERLLTAHGDPAAARETVEQQLIELARSLNFDVLTIFDSDGVPRAGVMRSRGSVVAIDPASLNLTRAGIMTGNGQIYEVFSVGIRNEDKVLGSLAIGDHLDVGAFPVPILLMRNGSVLQSSLSGVAQNDIETALTVCPPEKECEITLQGDSYLSVPLLSGALDQAISQGYSLRTLQSVDAASGPVQSALRNFFIGMAVAISLGAFAISILSSRLIARPTALIAEQLRRSEETGLLPEFRTRVPRIQEIRALTEGFNRAATGVRESRVNLMRAYVEFTSSLASALEARDPYTAGHSRRVSDYSCAIARVMHLSQADLDVIRIGALLHDLGKIGIADSLLRKPGKLTAEEAALLQEHPVIGRKILEGVQGFQNYLDIVELHHENWDGSGYPHGLVGAATPLCARIVKVADAYDALTSDRPYRAGMAHEEALRMLRRNTGTQIDPEIMTAFENIQLETIRRTQERVPARSVDLLLHSLSGALSEDSLDPQVSSRA